MLNRRTNKPDAGTLDKQAAGDKDADPGVTRIINVVIGDPDPVVLHVQVARGRGNVHAHEAGNAIGLDEVGLVRGDSTVGDLEL